MATTNDTSGVKNICAQEYATRPLYSANEWSEKMPSFPENQNHVRHLQSEMLILNAAQWNMSLYGPQINSNQKSADSCVSQMEYLRIYHEQVEKLKALHKR